MHNRIAVEAVTGSSPRIRAATGNTAVTASAEKRMIRNPITAFQNPATIHGSVRAKSASNVMSMMLKPPGLSASAASRSEEHTSELQSLAYLVCRLLLEKKKQTTKKGCVSVRCE